MTAALRAAEGFLSAQDLHALLRQDGQSVGLSTVYRCLHDLLESGAADVVISENGEALYRVRYDGEHRHFLVCRSCGRAVEIRSPAIEHWLNNAGQDNGFDRLEHRIEIFGRCPQCRERAPRQ